MVGRTDDVRALSKLLAAKRFVTVVGPGGVGKTTLAVAVGHELLTAFDRAVLFVDLGMLTDPKLLVTNLAAMLGLSVQSEDALPGIVTHLREKRLLLILDTCEHLIGRRQVWRLAFSRRHRACISWPQVARPCGWKASRSTSSRRWPAPSTIGA
jgi:predicted ATPase